MPRDYVIKIPPLCYLHVQDRNDNVTRMEVGPRTFTCMDHETVILGPEPMKVIPPRHYCVIADPVMRDGNGVIQFDKHGQVKLRHGDREVRLEQEPFPLYPGEALVGKMEPLLVVPENKALRLRAIRDLKDKGLQAGAEWLFEGPGTYIPRVDVDVVESLAAHVLRPGQALRLRARRTCTDKKFERERKMGEEWLVTDEGAYLPSVDEEAMEVIDAVHLSQDTALHMRALADFHDPLFGVDRRSGDHWLVTYDRCHSYIRSPFEELVGTKQLITLDNRHFAAIRNPIDEDGSFLLGEEKLVRGPARFFLQPPHEQLLRTEEVQVLAKNEALILMAKERFEDPVGSYAANKKACIRYPGETWYVYGPGEFWPPLEVSVRKRVRAAFGFEEPVNFYVFQPGRVALSGLLVVLAIVLMRMLYTFLLGRDDASYDEL
eukprot:TRINITY_DN1061_c0_g1_i1.p1 TRINITY_DN1061_c0_g1~~TRINITY_DN1061_c0_g1_i1.p1  ORF type:complete len:470 (-),score=135.03 TRINITY_DN1061_c0_g1_i1:1111-2409(-)